MRLVDDDREVPVAMLAADIVKDERKLLDRGDDDLLVALDEPAQIARMLRVPDRRTYLRELLDRVADLLIQNPSVRDDYDRVEHRGVVPSHPDELVSEPCDGVGLAAAG